MQITTLGVDLAKDVFQLHGVDEKGRCRLQKTVRRSSLTKVMAKLPACLVGVEACGGAHHWAREFRRLGHDVRMINPQYVKPYVKTQKNDYNDAEAICEAVSRPNMYFVPIKEVEHQDILIVHRVRSRLPAILEDAENGLSARFRASLAVLYEELAELDERVQAVTNEITRICSANPRCQRLAAIEGIGPITATALVAALGDAHVFRNGRQVAAWLGLVPRQYSSGGRTVLLGITKRGDRYLRMLLIHGARSVVTRATGKADPRSRWINALRQRRGFNKACVAIANKNARIAWALLAKDEDYRRAA